MIADGVLGATAMGSPLLSASTLNPKGGSSRGNVVATLVLTSLIDAFSILVIYLLMNFSNSGEVLYISKDMKLPSATQIADMQRATLIKIEKGELFLEEKPISIEALLPTLIEKRKEIANSVTVALGKKKEDEAALTIQADKRIRYKDLSKIVQAGVHAGFSEIKFAVLAK
ncbi:MAG: biopolymer transporter ExbD [Bacteriovoracales bacterium]|nr:biopolymer transporter ExbD [Bacteriovoracales bacterium]